MHVKNTALFAMTVPVMAACDPETCEPKTIGLWGTAEFSAEDPGFSGDPFDLDVRMEGDAGPPAPPPGSHG